VTNCTRSLFLFLHVTENLPIQADDRIIDALVKTWLYTDRELNVRILLFPDGPVPIAASVTTLLGQTMAASEKHFAD